VADDGDAEVLVKVGCGGCFGVGGGGLARRFRGVGRQGGRCF
jgi:hypothetical protein